MKKIIGIYIITSPKGRIYIGQSIDIYDRWDTYMSLSCEAQTKLYRSLKKHGVENHTFEIIDTLEVDDEHELDWLEIYFIKYFNSFNTPHGLNLKEGGSHGRASDESRKRMSKSHLGKVPVNKGVKGQKSWNNGLKSSIETRKKQSESHFGQVSWNKGIKGQKAWNKDIKMSEEQTINMRKPKSQEHKKNISKSKKGKPAWNKGLKMSDESNRKNSESHIGIKRLPESIAKQKETNAIIKQERLTMIF